jgi:transposase InsO family protein
MVSEPGERLACDFLGPFPPDDWYIHCMIDCFDDFVELTTHDDCTALSAATSLLTVAGRTGLPREILSDSGPAYISELIREFLEFFETNHRFILPYRPQANLAERCNKEVLRHLRAICFDFRVKENLRPYVPMVQRLCNSSFNRRVGTAPMRIRYGDTITLNRGLLPVWTSHGQVRSYEDYVGQLSQQLDNMVAASQEYQAAERQQYLDRSPPNPHVIPMEIMFWCPTPLQLDLRTR